MSAPLWDTRNSNFAGLLTSTDFINVIQYYCQYPDEIGNIDQFRLSSLRGKELLRVRKLAGCRKELFAKPSP